MEIVTSSSIVLGQLRFCEECVKPMGKGSPAIRCITESNSRHWICSECYEKLEKSKHADE